MICNNIKKYNLILISSGLTIIMTGCWLAAVGAGAEAGYIVSQEDRTAGETVDDQIIVSSIKTKLLADPAVSGLDINVDSFKGNVKLKGIISSENERQKAIIIANSVGGVKSVQTNLLILEEN